MQPKDAERSECFPGALNNPRSGESRTLQGFRRVGEACPGLSPIRAVRVPTGCRVFFLTGFPMSKSLLPCQPFRNDVGPSGRQGSVNSL